MAQTTINPMSSPRCPCGGVGHIGKKLARLVGVGLILPLDGSSFVHHVEAFQASSHHSALRILRLTLALVRSAKLAFFCDRLDMAELIGSGSVAAPCQL
jgi:hypothetical protein